jgi:hypothetical protein
MQGKSQRRRNRRDRHHERAGRKVDCQEDVPRSRLDPARGTSSCWSLRSISARHSRGHGPRRGVRDAPRQWNRFSDCDRRPSRHGIENSRTEQAALEVVMQNTRILPDDEL